MKSFFTFVLLLVSGILYSQTTKKLYYDILGKGVDSSRANYYRVAKFDAAGKPVDSVHDYYMSGEPRLKGMALSINADTDENSKWVGNLLVYYKSGNLLANDNYDKNGKMDSVCIRYFESGKIKQYIVSKHGAVVGYFFKEWDEFGNCEKVFRDKFKYNNNKNNWPLNTNEHHDCRIIKDSGLYMETYADNGVIQVLDLPLDQDKKFSVETSVQYEGGNNTFWHGLVWGFKDWENYYFFYINAEGFYRIGSVYEGVLKFNPKSHESDAIVRGKATNHLKIIEQGGRMYYSINGKVVCQTPYYTFTGNNVGFIIPEGKQQLLFKNIEVRQSTDDNGDGYADGGQGGSGLNEFKGWKVEGSGFFIDPSGYIVTNFHIIKGGTTIEVDMNVNGNRKFYKATVVASDQQNDLALLKIDDTKFTPFDSLPYNFKTDISDVGTNVFVLGYPIANVMGTEVKFTDGKISSKTGINGSPETYQISAPVTHGNSGGPVFDNDGNVIGIVRSIFRADQTENATYAIKSSYLKNFIDSQSQKISLPGDPSIAAKSLTDKIKILSNYVVMLKVK